MLINKRVAIHSDNPTGGVSIPLTVCNNRIRSDLSLQFSNKIEEETKNMIEYLNH